MSGFLKARRAVFWDEKQQRWASEGVKGSLPYNSKDHVDADMHLNMTCYSSHLTVFAAVF